MLNLDTRQPSRDGSMIFPHGLLLQVSFENLVSFNPSEVTKSLDRIAL